MDAAEHLWKAYRNAANTQGPDRDALVAHYLPWVRRIALWFCRRLPPSVNAGDLEQSGAIGLLEAIDRAASIRTSSQTFAQYWIKKEMLAFLDKGDGLSPGQRRHAKASGRALQEPLRDVFCAQDPAVAESDDAEEVACLLVSIVWVSSARGPLASGAGWTCTSD